MSTKKTYGAMALMLLISGLLAACGGGGGSSSTPTNSNTTPTTPTPPPAATGTIVNTYPTSGRHISPKVVFNGAGVGLAVWESADAAIDATDHTGRAIWYSLYQNGAWSQEAILHAFPDSDSNSGGSTGYFHLQAAASATGFGVVWLQQDRTNSSAPPYYYFMTNLYARVFDGTNWGSVSSIETRATPVSQPAIGSNGSGYLVAWEQYNDSTSKDAINGNFYSGGAWQGVVEIASAGVSTPLGNPRVASNGSGYATAWSEFNGATYWNNARIYAGSWGASQSFAGLTGYSATPYLESSGGNYMLAWSQPGGASTAYSSIGSGTTWSAPAGVALFGLAGLKASSAGYAAVYPCADPVTPADTSLCAKVYASGTWGSEVLLENVSGSNAANPVLATDGSGYGVLWRQYNQTTSDYSVYHTAFIAATTTATAATPIQVTATKSEKAGGVTPPTSSPREAIAYDGTGYMLGWIQQTAATSREEIYAQHYSGATAGTKNMLLTLVHDSGVHSATLTTNNAGIKLATWQQYYFDTTGAVPTYKYGLFAAATNASGVWGAPMLLSSLGNSAQVISNGTSFAIVYNSSTQYVAVRIYDPGTSTLSAQQNQSISIGYDPKIATNGSGYLMSWWETGSYPIYASIYNGTSWSAPVSIGGANGYGIPQVASNGTGYAVAWQHYDSVTAANHAYANVYNGTAWSGSQLIDTQSTAMAAPIPSASTPHIASNGTSYTMVWMQNNGTIDSIYTSLYTGTWSTPATIGDQTAAALFPEVASNGTSYMTAWQQGTNCYARMWSSGSWQALSNLGACAGAITNTDSNLTMATDGVGYAFAFQTASGTYGSYAAAYSNGAWGAITGVAASGCGGPAGIGSTGSTGWVLRGGSGGYGVVSLCNGGLYSNFDLYGSFFHGSGWSTSALLESGAYAVGYGIDLSADGSNFTAAWTQPHESQPDPSTRKFYMRSGL